MEFDDIFKYLKDFGVYQLVIFLMLGLTSYYPGWQNMGMAMLASDMEHWCDIPRLQNFSFDQQKYIAIPYDEDNPEEYSSCQAFDLPYDTYTNQQLWTWNRSQVPEDTLLIDCKDWVYDQSEFVSTALSKYDLVCDDDYLVSLSSTIYLLGMLVGAPLSGILSDKFGRKSVLIAGSVGHLVSAIAAAYAPGYWSFTIIRFFISVTAHVAFLCGFVIVMEITAPKYRSILGTFYHGFFSIGYMSLPVFAYFIRDMTYVQLCMAIPVVVSLSFVFIIPESPRWLISKGRYEEALDVVKELAEVNNETLPADIDFRPTVETEVCNGYTTIKGDPEKSTVKSSEEGSIFDLFKYPILRKEILIIYLGWFTNSLLYYGLGLNAGSLPGSIFVNVFIGGAIEIPAVFVTLWGMYYVGRRKSLAWGFVVAAIANFACIPLLDTENLDWLLIFFSMFGKACIKLTFIVSYAYTTELFPTPVRHIAVGSSSMMSRFGGLLAPFMGEPLMNVWAPLPSLIFGGIALLSGLLSFLLPETLNKDMPDTIEEAEELGRSKKNKKSKEKKDKKSEDVTTNGTLVKDNNVNANGIANTYDHDISTYL